MTSYKIQLNCGRQIDLRELNQSLTYDGLLEGLPTKQMNAHTLGRVTKEATLFGVQFKPHLIEPDEEPIDWGRDRPYPFGDPSALPPIQCQARFESFQPARDPNQQFSGLILVWFQHLWALPVEEAVLEQIKALNWNEIAHDYEP